MSSAVAKLIETLDLERIEDNIFRGHSPQAGWQRVFGGLVIAQSLVAAERTVPADRLPHSLHAYFLLPGDPRAPIVYEVDRIRDGKSFATRRCNAVQHGRPIFSLSASFHVSESGFSHAFPLPDVIPPENLPDEAAFFARFGEKLPPGLQAMRGWLEDEGAIELRLVDPSHYLGHKRPEATQYVWVRAKGRLPDDPAVHRAVLAYLSDMTLLDVAMVAHGRTLFDPDIQIASLDHALWFHRPFRADDWLLYAQDSPNSGGARGLTRGLIYSRAGELVASVAQEGLLRLLGPSA
ncbi:acyl-CoA thioesterase II [Methylovirgula ligni]|uniref:Acyl-CoA thioesterase 2 n=1 Tax=Methylovirgula ligni TaxID=569860 RepID=A0A3D9Z5E1_9HYPH|nr:acyl-CoA thioesterase II [Methylovirgula ligni]QAY95217.1 acyl-CoA thioesterase II [Methylovirgula ligni]REF89488.1 (3S)-malyl-CoA thioesterase [Methylovirgula ligni]